MKIGITGHQEREGIDWRWVRHVLHAEFDKIGKVDRVLSSLAAGSDQLFAEVALSLGIPVTAVIPVEDYARFFKGSSLDNYTKLLSRCEPLRLAGSQDPERAFYEAGKLIVDQADVMFAIWDGEKAEGLGGTGDIVMYARSKGKPVVHIEPINRFVHRLG